MPSSVLVTNVNDSGPGSLRAAITGAQNGDTINFAANLDGQTISLTGGELAISRNLTITGPGANQLTVSGNHNSRVFDIQSATVAISGLTISGGNGSGGNGAGIFSNGNLTLTGDTITGNSFTALGLGGGVYNSSSGRLVVTNSTVSANRATQGGGLDNDGGTTLLINSTIAGNTANSFGIGGGGGVLSNGLLSLENDTIAGNAAQGGFGSEGGGINAAGTFAMTNTIVARNTAATGPDLYGIGFSGDHNLIGGDPKLGPLQNNGGPTPTMALLAGSPALNAGTATGAPAADQRGVPRTGGINLGAYQASASTLHVSGYPASITAGTSGSLGVTAVDPYGYPAPGYRGTVSFSSTDPQAVLPAGYTFTAADNGSHTFSIVLKTAGTQALTAAAGGLGSSGTQSGISVVPAAARSVLVSGFPVTVTAGTPGALTATLQDAYGNVASGYRGTVHVTSSDGQAVLPSNYTFTAADAGSHPFSVILKTAGLQSLTVTDTGNAALTGGTKVAFDQFAVTGHAHGIARGPDGNVWFTEDGLNRIGKINPAGGATDYPVPTFGAAPFGITAGPDGNLWFTEFAVGKVGKITPAGTITEYRDPASGQPYEITAGPDGNLWFTNLGNQTIGKITPAGAVTDYPLDTFAEWLTAGPDGNLWFTTQNNKVGKITPAGVVTEYAIPTANSVPYGITEGADGNLWFAENQGNKIGKITPSGAITEYAIPTANSNPIALTAGLDGNVWFTETFGNNIGRITGAGAITEYPVPNSQPYTAITAASDGSLWFTEAFGNQLGRLRPAVIVTPAAIGALTVTGFPSPTTAGAAGSVTVTATDAYGNTIPGYTGTVHLTSADPQAVLPADYHFTAADHGVHTFSGIVLKTAGVQSLTATDTTTAGITGTQSGIMVNAAAAMTLTVSGFPSPVQAGTPGTFTVTAWDAYGNVATSYIGGIYFSSTDGRASLPGPYQFTPGDRGSHTFTAMLNTPGTQRLTATAPAGGMTGTQSGITVTAAAAVSLSVAGFPASVTAGTAGTFTVTLKDIFGNIATGYRGTVHFSSSDAQAVLPADYTFTAADAGVHTFSATLTTAGAQTLTATDTVNGALTGIFVSITEITLPTANSIPDGITVGADGNLWFTEGGGNHIGKITPAGAVTEYPVPTTKSAPYWITAGPDGNLWFTENDGNKIGRITPAGAITEYPVPTTGSIPEEITAGPDGNLWFTEFFGNKVAKITPAGVITEYAIPTSGSEPEGITTGPDGNLWFTEQAGNKVGKITPAGGITEYTVPTSGSGPGEITTGPDGNLWFAEGNAGKIGRITPAGAFTEYPLPQSRGGPFGITAGPDGNLWFTELTGNKIGQITPAGVITEYPVPTAASQPFGITTGPDGALWFTELSKLGRLDPAIHVTPAALDHFSVATSVDGGSTVAGSPFDVTVIAQDAFNNTVTGYQGTVHFSSGDPFGAALPADYTFQPSDMGVAFFPAGATLFTAGVWDVTVTDTTSGLSGSDCVQVTPAAAVAFQVIAPASATSGMAFDVTVIAVDPFGNTDTNYQGTVTFGTSDPDPGVVLPPDYTFQSTDAGQVTFAAGVTLITPGDQLLSVTDTSSGINGSATVTVDGTAPERLQGSSRIAALDAIFQAMTHHPGLELPSDGLIAGPIGY